MTNPTFETVLYETPAPGVARIVQNRPDARNAQDLQMTYDLNAAFDHAAQDGAIKVIILAGADPHFSAGHDLRGDGGKELGKDFTPVTPWSDFKADGIEGLYGREEEIYLGMCRRWRDVPKPTIAAVQGKCIAGGLMLAWCCDLIVASEDATFQDPVVNLGVMGVEYFAHPFELGIRKAKEHLFTSDAWTAEEARQMGMVNRVVPREELSATVLAMAEKIAAKPMFALKMAKEALNQAQDTMGFTSAMDQAYTLQVLCHAHNKIKYDMVIDPSGIPGNVRAKREQKAG